MEDILKKSAEHYDLDFHRYMAIEEMSELTKELCKNRRGKDNLEHIAEEIADVLITIDQLIICYNCEELVNTIRNMKINRLERRMEMDS